MLVIAIAWMYVVLMMALAEALSPQGSVIGAIFTFLLYGVLPLGILMYILGTPGRKRRLKAKEAFEAAQAKGSDPPDGGGHAAGDAVAPVRKEP